jgi:hypothetical protein
LDVGGIDGVVHVFEDYPIVPFIFRFVCVEGGILLRKGFDDYSIGIWGFRLDSDLIVREGFDHILLIGYLIKKVKERRDCSDITDENQRRFRDRYSFIWI